MIVSALLTSVGINLGLCSIFLALFSVLRKRPGNAKVYAARLVDAGAGDQPGDEEVHLPSGGWLRRAWRPSEDELVAASGLDGVVFMRIFVFSLRVFGLAGIVGMFVLLPANYWGDQLRQPDFSDLPNTSLDLFSISNVKDGSNRLWIHFGAVYFISGVVCYLLYIEYDFISSKRLAEYNASKPLPHHFTILVRGVPSRDGSSFNDAVENFFMDYYPSVYLSHRMIHRTSRLRGLTNDAEHVYRRLNHLKSQSEGSQNAHRGAFHRVFHQKVDLVRDYSRKLENLEENVRIEQSDISSRREEEVPAAFVFFRSRHSAATVLHMQQSNNPTEWVTEQAPEPSDIYWPLFSTSFMQIWLSKLVVIIASALLTVIFLVPVAFVQGLTNLDQLEALFPFLKGILNIKVLSQVITGYLPSIILYVFLTFIPPIIRLFSAMQGHISQSEIEKSACRKMLWFTMWNVFFANVLAGSVTSQLQIFLDPKYIPSILAMLVPAQASFFISYVVTSWTSLSLELTRTFPLIGNWLRRHCSCCHEHQDPSIPYDTEIPRILLFGLIGLTYFLLAPVILPFILIYFGIGYLVYRNQLLNVYVPKYETGGRFWPIVHDSSIFSLVLMQAIAFGTFGLKKLPVASSLILPLPVLTLMFNEYCRKRFLPIFCGYPAESLIKKDREERNDPVMDEFFAALVDTYRDPALLPMRYSPNPDSQGMDSPLLAPGG